MISLVFKVFILHGECRFRCLLFIKESKHLNPGSRLLSGQDQFLSPRFPLETAHLGLTNLKMLRENLCQELPVRSTYEYFVMFALHQWALELGR